MAHRKKIEIYSAGCRICQEAEIMVRRIAGADHDVEVLDMHQAHVATRAALHGIKSVPSVVLDSQLTPRCVDTGLIEGVLRATITRTP